MRLLKLHLAAYGRFTARELDFSEPSAGLHVVYGLNEAGKSTTLRAISDFLFGIPNETPDAFLHEPRKLRIGMTLQADGGEPLTLFRRKGRKDTLLDADGAPLSESVLLDLLEGVDEQLFAAMFGLDHERLRRGAKELLDASGSVSESLFGAGSGTLSSRVVLQSLRGGADELFTERGRGRKRINQGIEAVRSARQAVAAASVSARAFVEHERDLLELQRELDELKTRRDALRAEERGLLRLLALVPHVARLRQIEQQLRRLGPVPHMPLEVREWRIEAMHARDQAQRDLALYTEELRRARERLDGLAVQPSWQGLDPRLCEDFTERLGQHRKAQRDLPKREGELSALHHQIERLLRELGVEGDPSSASEYRLSRTQELQLRRLADDKTRYEAQLQARSEQAQSAAATLRQRKKILAASRTPAPSAPLERALQRARAQLDKKSRADALRERATALQLRLEVAAKDLVRFGGDAAVLLQRALPDESTVLVYAQRYAEGAKRRGRLLERREEAEARKLRVRADLRALEGGVEVPDHQRLSELRADRDELLSAKRWDAAARQALGAAIRTCDVYGDRLVAEATRTSQKAQLQSELQALAEQDTWLEKRLEEETQALIAIDEEWARVWQELNLKPASPEEMRAWLVSAERQRSEEEERRSWLESARELEKDVAVVTRELSEALQRAGEAEHMMWESLPQLVDRAQDCLTRARSAEHNHTRLTEQVQAASADVDEATAQVNKLQTQYKEWRGEWQRALKALSLSKDAGSDAVYGVLDVRTELQQKVSEAEALGGRIESMRRDAGELDRDIRQVLDRVMPMPSSTSTDECVTTFIAAQRQYLADQVTRLQLEADCEQHATASRRASGLMAEAEQRLQELMQRAGAQDLEQLVELEQRLEKARALEAQRENLVTDILAQGGGRELARLVEEVAALDTEHAEERRSAIGELIRPIEERIEAVVERRATLERELNRFRSGANRAAEELAAEVASLKRSAAEYVRLRLAALLLEQEIERYREAHQGPVITHAQQLFPRLTCGQYTGLRTGFDRKDQQILLCVQANGAEVEVSQLSDGTRDQLYLALRLASLLHFLKHRRAMPLVLDDILIHFDDHRARAALEVLSEVAMETQVVFFTHHSRLVDLAQAVVPSERLGLHVLSSETPNGSVREVHPS